MKPFLNATGGRLQRVLFYLLPLCSCFMACKKNDSLVSPSAQSAAEYDEAVRGGRFIRNHRDQWLERRLAALTLKEKLNNIG